MNSPNPLVAERQDSTTAITGIGIAESAADVYNGISNGSWLETGLGLGGVGLEALSIALNPVGTLVSYAVSWLMEHVKPLSDALDSLAGDPDTIASYSATWKNVSEAVASASESFATEVRQGTAGWHGDAADAYRKAATSQGEQLTAAATAADTISTVVSIVGTVVAAVRETVRDLIAECISTLVTRIPRWIVQAITIIGLPFAIAEAVNLISKWVRRIADLIKKLVRSVNNLRPLLSKLQEIWESIKKTLCKLGGGHGGPGKASHTQGPGGQQHGGGFAELDGDGTPDVTHYDANGKTIQTPDLQHPHVDLLDPALLRQAEQDPNRVNDALKPGADINDPNVQATVPSTYDPHANMSEPAWNQKYWPTGGRDEYGNRLLKWPDPNDHPQGFARPEDRRPTVLNPGATMDRFGPGFGQFASPVGTPYPQRAIPPDNLDGAQYHRYRVVRPIPVWEGEIAPAMGQPGGGTQYFLPKSVVDLVNARYLEEIT